MHPLDYFYFNVFKNEKFNPNDYANTMFMYRFHKKLNDKKYTKYFFNKMLFHQKFKEYMGHGYINLKKTNINELRKWIIDKKPDSLIIKKINSVGGFGVKRVRIKLKDNDVFIDNQTINDKFQFLQKFDLIEEFVVQHELINKINPSCLNTVRVATVLDKDNTVNILGAVIRFGVNNDVDNFHSGGIAVNINVLNGCLEGDGFRLAPSEPEFYPFHPTTNIKFDGYQLPHWPILINTIKKACYVIPQARTIGWDIAITPNGVSLIEGNHDWDKIIIEKALKRGIRKELEKYIQ